MKVKVFADFDEALDADIRVESEKQVELVIDYSIAQFISRPRQSDTIRFFCNIQPEGHYNQMIREHQSSYDYLLTFIPELLTLPKSKFFIGLTPFCEPQPSTDKIFGVSAVFSGRNCLPGHRLRYELWRRRNEINIPRYFYAGQRTMIPGVDYSQELTLPATKSAKQEVMKTMFHICIDSYDYDNSFSEKLIDPMINKTIPIYWGARNVNQFFNGQGIFQVNNVDDIINYCNYFTHTDYKNYLPFIEENYKTALNYYDYGKQLQRKIQEVINENKYY